MTLFFITANSSLWVLLLLVLGAAAFPAPCPCPDCEIATIPPGSAFFLSLKLSSPSALEVWTASAPGGNYTARVVVLEDPEASWDGIARSPWVVASDGRVDCFSAKYTPFYAGPCIATLIVDCPAMLPVACVVKYRFHSYFATLSVDVSGHYGVAL